VKGALFAIEKGPFHAWQLVKYWIEVTGSDQDAVLGDTDVFLESNHSQSHAHTYFVKFCKLLLVPPKFNIAAEKWWLED